MEENEQKGIVYWGLRGQELRPEIVESGVSERPVRGLGGCGSEWGRPRRCLGRESPACLFTEARLTGAENWNMSGQNWNPTENLRASPPLGQNRLFRTVMRACVRGLGIKWPGTVVSCAAASVVCAF